MNKDNLRTVTISYYTLHSNTSKDKKIVVKGFFHKWYEEDIEGNCLYAVIEDYEGIIRTFNVNECTGYVN